MTKLVGILGSVTPPGRLFRALQVALEAGSERGVAIDLLDLAGYRLGFADGRPLEQLDDDTPRLVKIVATADCAVLASPVYRGSLTGVLKNFLDLLPLESLQGKPCGIIAMGATQHHYLGVDWHLRTVLAWFGALVAPTSVYLSSADFSQGEPSPAARADLRALVQTTLALEQVVDATGADLGPPPLAGRQG